MKQTRKELLEKLIEGDEIPEVDFRVAEGYSHRKSIVEVGGNPLDWALLSKIIHTWVSIEDELFKKEFKKELIVIEGEFIKYRPSIIKDFLLNHA